MLLIKNQKIKYFDKYQKDLKDTPLLMPLFFKDNMQSFEELNQYFIHKVCYLRTWKSENTLNSSAQHLLDFFLYLEDNKLNWKNLNNDILVCWRDNIRKSGILGKPLSNTTVNSRLQAVLGFYDFCLIENYIEKHPFLFKTFHFNKNDNFNQKNTSIKINTAVAKLPKSDTKITIPSIQDIGIFLSQKMAIETRLMALLMYETGMRREEVYTLNKEAIENIILTEDLFYPIYLDNNSMKTKGSKNRTIIIEKNTLSLLKNWLTSKRRKENNEKYIKKFNKSSSKVFISRKGNEFKNDSLNKSFINICKKCNFDDHKITPHILRHSFATHNLVYNLDKFNGSEERMLQWLSNRLGHASVSVTREHYIHFVNDLKIRENETLTRFEKEILNLKECENEI